MAHLMVGQMYVNVQMVRQRMKLFMQKRMQYLKSLVPPNLATVLLFTSLFLLVSVALDLSCRQGYAG